MPLLRTPDTACYPGTRSHMSSARVRGERWGDADRRELLRLRTGLDEERTSGTQPATAVSGSSTRADAETAPLALVASRRSSIHVRTALLAGRAPWEST